MELKKIDTDVGDIIFFLVTNDETPGANLTLKLLYIIYKTLGMCVTVYNVTMFF